MSRMAAPPISRAAWPKWSESPRAPVERLDDRPEAEEEVAGREDGGQDRGTATESASAFRLPWTGLFRHAAHLTRSNPPAPAAAPGTQAPPPAAPCEGRAGRRPESRPAASPRRRATRRPSDVRPRASGESRAPPVAARDLLHAILQLQLLLLQRDLLDLLRRHSGRPSRPARPADSRNHGAEPRVVCTPRRHGRGRSWAKPVLATSAPPAPVCRETAGWIQACIVGGRPAGPPPGRTVTRPRRAVQQTRSSRCSRRSSTASSTGSR